MQWHLKFRPVTGAAASVLVAKRGAWNRMTGWTFETRALKRRATMLHDRRAPFGLLRRVAWCLCGWGLAIAGCAIQNEPEWSQVKQSIRDEFGDVPQLTTQELAEWLEDSDRPAPLLLDAREQDEFEVSHLQGAYLATDLSQALRVLDDRPRETPIVVYCSVGYRSSRLSRQLKELGWTRVSNLEGSIFQWANEGRPVYRGTQPVGEVHPFDDHWGQLLHDELRWSG